MVQKIGLNSSQVTTRVYVDQREGLPGQPAHGRYPLSHGIIVPMNSTLWSSFLPLIVAASVLTLACSQTPAAPAPAAPQPVATAPRVGIVPARTPFPVASPPALSLPGPQSRILQPASVVRVIDGDTIEVNLSGRLYKVRYIGMDTPETVHPTRGVEPYGKEASERNRQLVEGRTVYLEEGCL